MRRAWIPWGVALLAVVAATTLGAALVRERGVRTDVEAVAAQFAEALLTYDSADLEEARERIRPLVTDRFFRNYEATLGSLAAVNSRAEGRAVEVFTDLGPDGRASAVVVTESQALTGGTPSTTRGSYLRLDLLHDGRWRVDAVVEVFAGANEGGTSDGSSEGGESG